MKSRVVLLALVMLVSTLQLAFAPSAFALTPPSDSIIIKEGDVVKNLHGYKKLVCQDIAIKLVIIVSPGAGSESYQAKFELLDSSGVVVSTATVSEGANLNGHFHIDTSRVLLDEVVVERISVESESGVGEVELIIVYKDHPAECYTPDIFVELGEKFSLLENQKAIVKNENLEIRLDKILVSYCTDEVCVDVFPTVYLTVSKHGVEENETSVATEIKLGWEESASVFGYTIQNTFIEKEKAGFIVTKETDHPDVIKVKLGEMFSLLENQTAKIYKDDKGIAKMTLEKISYFDEKPYKSFAFIVFSDSSGKTDSFYISQDTKKEVLGKYVVKLYELGKNKGAFSVHEIEKPGEDKIFVSLDKDFDLKQKQTAVVKETGFEIQFVKWEPIYCIETVVGPCPSGIGVFLVKDVLGHRPITGEMGEREDTLEDSSTYRKISIKEGDTEEVFGHKVTLNDLKIISVDEPTETYSLATANLTISTKETPDGIDVRLDHKFKLKVGQIAYVYEKKYSKEALLKVALEDIDFYVCATADELVEIPTQKCDARPYAKVAVSVIGGGYESFTLTEGGERQIGGFNVRLLDIGKGLKSAVFIVSKAEEGDYKIVFLDEKFGLTKKQTALVKEINLFIHLNDIVELEDKPYFVAKVSVWKTHKPSVKESFEDAARPTESFDDPAPPNAGTIMFQEYKMVAGETLELYGAKIQLLELNGSKAVFVVRSEKDPDIINVHLGDPFWLKENQAARVLRANMQIDLLGINYKEYCKASGEEPEETSTCKLLREVEIGVSNYLFDKGTVGKEISTQAIEDVVVKKSSADTEVVEETKDILLPPTPFKIYTLREGEEVTVNDFTIRVLSIEPHRAEFVVKGKTTGHTVTYRIFRGWNLFSLPGELDVEESTCNSSEWKLFEYNKKGNIFKKVKKPKPGIAYWLYNPGEDCKVKAGIRHPVRIKDLHPLTKGWNFVPTTVDMIGKQLSKLGNCEVKAVFEWNAEKQGWVNTTNEEVNKEDFGRAFAVFTKNNCKLGKDVELPLSPPSFPDIEEKPKIDKDAILDGVECGIGATCPKGYSCNVFKQAGIEKPACIREPVCLQVKCPSGTKCAVMESYPGQIACG